MFPNPVSRSGMSCDKNLRMSGNKAEALGRQIEARDKRQCRRGR